MKKISGLVAATVLALGASASANALVMKAGNVTITLRAYDAGTTGYTGNCVTVAGCDAVAGNKSPYSVGSEDTWGIFSVQSIIQSDNDPTTPDVNIFSAGDGGKYLTGMFGGLEDKYVTVVNVPGVNITSTHSVGGWLNMYWNNSNIDVNVGPDGRLTNPMDPNSIGAQHYQGITDQGGALALSANFSAAADANFAEATYTSLFNNVGFSGSGGGFLDITGGDLAAQLATKAEADAFGNMHDLYLKTTFGTLFKPAQDAGWTVDASGDVDGEIGEVPEPGSLALLGLGFAGLAGLRRRKAAK